MALRGDGVDTGCRRGEIAWQTKSQDKNMSFDTFSRQQSVISCLLFSICILVKLKRLLWKPQTRTISIETYLLVRKFPMQNKSQRRTLAHLLYMFWKKVIQYRRIAAISLCRLPNARINPVLSVETARRSMKHLVFTTNSPSISTICSCSCPSRRCR